MELEWSNAAPESQSPHALSNVNCNFKFLYLFTWEGV